MLSSILVSIVSKILKVDVSEDAESTTVPSSNQLEPTGVQESQPSFLYTKESLDALKKIFPKTLWDRNKDIEDLAFNAGQQSVITYIENRLGKEIHKVLR